MDAETLGVLHRRSENVDHLIHTIFILQNHKYDVYVVNVSSLLDAIKEENEQIKLITEREIKKDDEVWLLLKFS